MPDTAPAWEPLSVPECSRCGFSFPRLPEQHHRLCPECRCLPPAVRALAPLAPSRLALLGSEVGVLRAAVEHAAAALRTHRPAEALAVLEACRAPARDLT
jgi:hypothetical protein